jgi:serine/threonine-protein kinase HipA
MTSDHLYEEAYVWIWLPGKVQPVVAGLLSRSGRSRAVVIGLRRGQSDGNR